LFISAAAGVEWGTDDAGFAAFMSIIMGTAAGAMLALHDKVSAC
jgi:hypothetical protein